MSPKYTQFVSPPGCGFCPYQLNTLSDHWSIKVLSNAKKTLCYPYSLTGTGSRINWIIKAILML